MTSHVSLSWDIPPEVQHRLKDEPALQEVVEDCYSDLYSLLWYNRRRMATTLFTSAGCMAMLGFAYVKWNGIFSSFNMWHLSLIVAVVGLVGARLGWHLGGIKKRQEMQEIRNTLLRALQRDTPACRALGHIRDRDPRPEYKKIAQQLFDLANEEYAR